MNSHELRERWARLSIGGLNLQRGQALAIKGEPVHHEMIERVARHAYRAGAQLVDFWASSAAMERARVDHSAAEALDYVPDYYVAQRATVVRDRWAFLSIKSPDDPHTFEGADHSRIRAVAAALVGAEAEFRRALSNDATQWLVMALPSPRWAAQVLGCEPSTEAVERLWDLLTPIMRLDASDPVAFWADYGATLRRRAAVLNQLQLRQLHFQAPGTDLRVGLHPAARWLGGGAVTRSGLRFMPNLPTEEVFTAPDWRHTTGKVQVTCPAMVQGQIVRGAWFEFAEGRVVDFGATEGAQILSNFLDIDPGSRAAGEIALVDTASPIFRSGRTFFNTLLDENATCHLALGFAYPTCIEGGEAMTDEQLDQHGSNRSRQHADFMIGTADIEVHGVDAAGKAVPIITGGKFALPD